MAWMGACARSVGRTHHWLDSRRTPRAWASEKWRVMGGFGVDAIEEEAVGGGGDAGVLDRFEDALGERRLLGCEVDGCPRGAGRRGRFSGWSSSWDVEVGVGVDGGLFEAGLVVGGFEDALLLGGRGSGGRGWCGTWLRGGGMPSERRRRWPRGVLYGFCEGGAVCEGEGEGVGDGALFGVEVVGGKGGAFSGGHNARGGRRCGDRFAGRARWCLRSRGR